MATLGANGVTHVLAVPWLPTEPVEPAAGAAPAPPSPHVPSPALSADGREGLAIDSDGPGAVRSPGKEHPMAGYV